MDIKAVRESMNIRDKQSMLLAFAWITGKELSLLRRFPEFLCGDVTERTNKEKRGLFLVTGQDGNNKSFIASHCYLPNSKMDTFDWIYTHAIPELATTAILLGNEVFITDGEDALFAPFINSTKLLDGPWKNSFHYRCTFHLFYQEWQKRLSGKIKDTEARKVVESIRRWIISLIHRVRLYSDYLDSVSQLQSFLDRHKQVLSDYVYQSIHQIFFVSMNTKNASWARFNRCKRMDLGHSTSSLCESNNKGLKETTGKNLKLASMNMDQAAKVAIAHSSNLLNKIER